MRVREWGSAGTGPGQFELPHSIVIDENGIIYFADRENGRIQRFDLEGKYLGEFANLGRRYSLKLSGGALWAGMQPLNEPLGAPGVAGEIGSQDRQDSGICEGLRQGRHSLRCGQRNWRTDYGFANHVEWFKARYTAGIHAQALIYLVPARIRVPPSQRIVEPSPLSPWKLPGELSNGTLCLFHIPLRMPRSSNSSECQSRSESKRSTSLSAGMSAIET